MLLNWSNIRYMLLPDYTLSTDLDTEIQIEPEEGPLGQS